MSDSPRVRRTSTKRSGDPGGCWTYWQQNGGPPVFGYLLIEELEEDGRTVQYFERAVFKYWPKNDPAHRVLLRRLGTLALAQHR